MLKHLKRSRHPIISNPFALNRTTTLVSTTDSSTASSADDASADNIKKWQRKTRHGENQRHVHIGDTFTSNVTTSTTKHKNSVKFGKVMVRKYDRTLGDWWDVQHGLALGWEYEEMPTELLPDVGEELKRERRKLRANVVKNAKAKVTGWFLISLKKQHSTGKITADSVECTKRTDRARIKKGRGNIKVGKSKRSPTYEDEKPTHRDREEILSEYGFSSCELKVSETERKLLRLEYLNYSGSGNATPSKLFAERCLADRFSLQTCATDPLSESVIVTDVTATAVATSDSG